MRLFYLNQILICPCKIFKKRISLLILRFLPGFSKFEHFRCEWVVSIRRTKFFGEISKNFFFYMFTWVLLDGFLNGFQKLDFLIWDFWGIIENYSMHMPSIRGNDFISHWAYGEMISSHTEHTPNEFSRMLSQRKNVNRFYIYRYAEHTGKWFYHTLSIRGNDVNGGSAYEEMISLLTEHTRKCSKVEYLGQIEYDFQKSHVTGPWNHKDSVSAKKYFFKIHACVPIFAIFS